MFNDAAEQPREWVRVRKFGEGCRLRAIEQARDLEVTGPGTMSVSSLSGHDRRRVTFFGRPGGIVWFTCSCPSGTYRDRMPIPCVHAAQAALRLQHEGLVAWSDGLVYRRRA